MDTPTAAKVPAGKLLPGSFKSPDMLTPWVKPVTAGKKMANRAQKLSPLCDAVQFWTSSPASHCRNPPIKKERIAVNRTAMTPY